jgi:vacuolar protein sorting-associated protein 13A/C
LFLIIGKGLAALTFDKDYQRKRQEQINKQPANLQEGLARSGKGLVMVRRIYIIIFVLYM